jgi:hypothetical protein
MFSFFKKTNIVDNSTTNQNNSLFFINKNKEFENYRTYKVNSILIKNNDSDNKECEYTRSLSGNINKIRNTVRIKISNEIGILENEKNKIDKRIKILINKRNIIDKEIGIKKSNLIKYPIILNTF